MKRHCILIGIVSTALCGPSAQGALIAYEGFNYPNDSDVLANQSGGAGWSAPWVDTEAPNGDFHHLTQNDVSLNLPGYVLPTSGDHLAGMAGEGSRNFNGGIDLSQDGNVLFASVLFRKDTDGGTGADNIEFDLGQDGGQTIRFGSSSGEQFFLTDSGNPLGTVELGKLYMLILKVTSSAASPDLVQGLIIDETESIPLVEPVTWDLTHMPNSNVMLNSVRLAMGNNASGAFDEVRIGTTWNDVAVPEPSSACLLILGVAVFFGLHRVRR